MPRPRSALRNWAEYLAARLVLWSSRGFPPVANGYARLLDIGVPRLRKTAMRNLALALPGADHGRIVDGVFRSIGRLLLSLAHFRSITPDNIDRWIRYEGFEHFAEAKRRGRGVLFATGHLGNWELSAFAHALLAEPMHVVVRPLDNPLIDRLVTGLRTASGNRVIEKKDFARGILKALARNEAVGILVDQNTAPDQGVFVNFFGIAACTNVGIAKIAARTGAAVIPGFALWSDEERRYVLRFYPPVEITGDALEDTRRIHAAVECAIREHPDQWLWIHRRWKTRPPGEPSLY
jgi:KDO2-lipid IV(A) lauroyltransferase